jgi:PAS domain S-box-containing protein
MTTRPMAAHDGKLERAWARYAFAVFAVLVVFALRRLLLPLTSAAAPFLMFFAAILVTSLVAGFRPAVLATLLSGLLGAWIVSASTPAEATLRTALFFANCAVLLYLSLVTFRAKTTAEQLAVEVAEATKRFREPIELAPEAFFRATLDGRFVLVNDAACRLLDRDRDELLAMTIQDLIPREDLPRLEAPKAALLAHGYGNLTEWRLRRKDGGFVTVEVVANIVGDRWQAFARDVTERKRAEDERMVLVSLVESASDFIGVADPQGVPIYVNPAGRRMIGMPAGYPVEQTRIADYYPPEQREFAEKTILGSLVERGRWSGETYFRHWQTGAAIPVSDEHFMVYDASGERLLGMGTVTRDISEAQRTAREREERLALEQEARRAIEAVYARHRAAEERLRLAIERAPTGMALAGLDGRFLQVNRALCEIVGYTAEELLRKRFQDITHPDDLAPGNEQASRLARGEIGAYRLEKRYVRRDGSSVTIHLSVTLLRGAAGEPPCYIAQMEDITDRKRSEAALRLLAQAGVTLTASLDLDRIMESVAGLIVREMADWCIVEVAEDHTRRVRVAGRAPAQAPLAREVEQASVQPAMRRPLIEQVWQTGQPVLLERVNPDDLQAYARSSEHLRLLRGLAPYSMLAVPLTSRGERLGVLVWISSSPHRVYDQNDVGLATTLAGRVALAVENTRLYQTAVQSTQLRDHVLGVVAHDLRNPLSVIRLQAAVMQPPAGQPERRNPKPRQTILRSTDRMNRLIQDLLDVAQIEAGQLGIERARISPTRFLSDTVDSMRAVAASASLDLELELGRDLPDILGDHDRLCQVIENLLGNAVKFTPPGGRIVVGARSQGDAVLYHVADTGRGIPPEGLAHVFDRFWQAQKGTHGTGLGLPIVRGLVEALGGRISVESTPGLGTTFSFTVPIAPPEETNGRGLRGPTPLV